MAPHLGDAEQEDVAQSFLPPGVRVGVLPPCEVPMVPALPPGGRRAAGGLSGGNDGHEAGVGPGERVLPTLW
eukprot:5546392-Alexandrium_andersonii.AAC.1